MKKEFWREIGVLFRPWELVFYFLFWGILNFSFFHFLTGHIGTSLFVGIIGSVFFFFIFTYQNVKLNTYQKNLNDLFKYVKNMSFFLGSDENVHRSLTLTNETVGKNIQKDIDKTLKIQKDDGILNTEHFRKYKFPSLDQFHQNLAIQYKRGGDPKSLYGSIQKSMMFELKSRDELYRKRKGFSIQVYFLLGMVGFMAIILRVFVTQLWDVFIEFGPWGIAVLLFNYGLALLNLYFLQKKKLDVSVRY